MSPTPAPTPEAAGGPLLPWQPSLLEVEANGGIGWDGDFATLERRLLPPDAWVDHAPGWVRGADRLFDELLATAPWEQRRTHLYDRRVDEPRMTARWSLEDDGPPLAVVGEMGAALGRRYAVTFTSVGCNLYRDGSDSVAWHGDRVARDLPEATIAIVSLGEPRAFKLRPKGGGSSRSYRLGHGDLLVMGGSCQRTWDHGVPKVRRAGPRISVQFRHAYDR